jgi:hypothetical protein
MCLSEPPVAPRGWNGRFRVMTENGWVVMTLVDRGGGVVDATIGGGRRGCR